MRWRKVVDRVAAAEHAWLDVVGDGRVVRIGERLAADPAGLIVLERLVPDALRCSRVRA